MNAIVARKCLNSFALFFGEVILIRYYNISPQFPDCYLISLSKDL